MRLCHTVTVLEASMYIGSQLEIRVLAHVSFFLLAMHYSFGQRGQRNSRAAYHQLEFLFSNDVLQLAEKCVRNNEEVSGSFVAAKDVLSQVRILASIDNQESLLCDVQPVVKSVSPLLCIMQAPLLISQQSGVSLL